MKAVSPISLVSNEILYIILSLLDAKTLMIVVPQVCKLWRSMCQELHGMHLDFRWWRGNVPAEVLSGWKQAPATVGGAHAGGGGGGSSSSAGGRGVKTGLCELFPRTTSVTMKGCPHDVKDAHLMALANKCPGITHADFHWCSNLTDAAVIALADKCPEITHAKFSCCWNLTDAAVVALADKCPGITHANFTDCWNLTDAAVIVLADKCPGITHAEFSGCENLTDATVRALADKCPGITHANFSECENLTDEVKASIEAQRPNCNFIF